VRETPPTYGEAPEDPLVRLERKLDAVATDVKQLKTDVGQLKADVETLKSDVAELKSDVAELKSDVAELKSDVAALKTDVARLKTDVGQLKSQVGQLQSDVNELKDGQSRYVTKVEFEGLRSELRMVADGFAATQQRLDYVADLIVRYRVG
jgi:outer membrane murein-binding lipoprotein Lpp